MFFGSGLPLTKAKTAGSNVRMALPLITVAAGNAENARHHFERRGSRHVRHDAPGTPYS